VQQNSHSTQVMSSSVLWHLGAARDGPDVILSDSGSAAVLLKSCIALYTAGGAWPVQCKVHAGRQLVRKDLRPYTVSPHH
jgi:hypothetical protein